MNAFPYTLSDWTMKGVATALRAIARAEKEMFFWTGVRGLVLRLYWNETGRILQKALNRQHGTAIRYGYIKQ